MSTKSIHSRAPTRVDLAGGTVDIWPLYLFLDRPLTINLGIDLFAEAKLTSEGAQGIGQITLRSADQKNELKLSWKDLSSFSAPPALELHTKLLRHFAALRGEKAAHENITLETVARSPAGAGLGGSSTLSIAMIGALATWAKGEIIDPAREGEALIEVARDVETTVIKVPAGLQDYYGAMFGGLQAIRWRAGRHERDSLPAELLPELEKRLLLFYSGQSRNSGINNWALFKGMIDNEGDVATRFQGINLSTQRLEKALLARDWNGVGESIAKEWAVRRTLASGISTAEMNDAFTKASQLSPGSSGKVCGAGGGGCFFVYLPDAGKREEIQKTIATGSLRALPFKAVPHGLQVSRA